MILPLPVLPSLAPGEMICRIEPLTLNDLEQSENLRSFLGHPQGDVLRRSLLEDLHQDDRALAEEEVCDNGPGIPEAILPRIFDPFFTTKPPGKGAGLGLAACHGIVTRHGGCIDVESHPNTRTCFRVRLPTPQSA